MNCKLVVVLAALSAVLLTSQTISAKSIDVHHPDTLYIVNPASPSAKFVSDPSRLSLDRASKCVLSQCRSKCRSVGFTQARCEKTVCVCMNVPY